MNLETKGEENLVKNNCSFIAITGCIGSGKSTVSNIIRELGYKVINTDLISKNLLNRPDIIHKLQSIIPHPCYIKGSLDYKKIGLFFDNNPKLEIMFEEWFQPILGEEIKAIYTNYSEKYLFFDIPMLFRKKIEDMFSLIININCDKKTCIKRVILRNEYNIEKAERLVNFSFHVYKGENIIQIENSYDISTLEFNIKNKLEKIIEIV